MHLLGSPALYAGFKGFVLRPAYLSGVLCFGISAGAHAVEHPVVTSIQPLQLIASDLLAGLSEPVSLLPAGASPHQYALKPSDMRRLKEAELTVWVGPNLERFLEKPLSGLEADRVLTLLDVEHAEIDHDHDHEAEHAEHAEHDGHDEHHEAHNDHDEHHADDGDGHDHGGVDPHIWMDPYEALDIASKIKNALEKQHPEWHETLDNNYARIEAEVKSLDQSLKAEFEPVHEVGFVVFHDAYQHFIQHYGLNFKGAVTLNPSQKPGARHMAELREQVVGAEAKCVFSEPQFNDSVVNSIVSGSQAKVAQLDPLGQSVTPGKGAITAFYRSFATPILECLKES
jgi:zinc transport system substrate-binding protein